MCKVVSLMTLSPAAAAAIDEAKAICPRTYILNEKIENKVA